MPQPLARPQRYRTYWRGLRKRGDETSVPVSCLC
jgi:hypothetical protein